MKNRAVCFLAILLLAFTGACTPAETASAPDGFLPEPVSPEGTFAPEVAHTSTGDKTVIMVPRFFLDPTYEDTVARLNGMLDKQGQHVEFYLESNTYSSRSDDVGSYLPQVQAELLSGNTTADAYAVYYWDANEILSKAPAMDLSTLLPTAAPLYYDKYKDSIERVFGKSLPGLPIGMIRNSYRVQTAFMLRLDYNEQFKPAIKSISDIFSFVENNVVAQKKVCSVLADPYAVAMQWALEQGYYNLDSFGIRGFLFAAADDKECKPVALETIPGFYDFMDRMQKLYKTGYFVYPSYATNGWDNIGMIRNLGEYYGPQAGNQYSWVSGQFFAHLLCAGMPSFYEDGTSFNGELLIPESSATAVDVIKFVEWLYSSQDNYNTVIYGEQGVDYEVSDGRLATLLNGKPAVFKTRSDMNRAFLAWPGVPLFSSSEYSLLPGNAPVNIEQLFDNGLGEKNRFPLDALRVSAKTAEQLQTMEPPDEVRTVIESRERLVFNMIYAMFMQGGDYKLNVKPLENLDTDRLLEECAYRIAKFKAVVEDGQP